METLTQLKETSGASTATSAQPASHVIDSSSRDPRHRAALLLHLRCLATACCLATLPAVARAQEQVPEAAEPAAVDVSERDPLAADAAPEETVPARSILAPTTITSRAVYTDETGIVADPSNVWTPAAPDTQIFRSGRLSIRPALSYLYLYGDGVLARPGIEEDTSIHAIAPSVVVGIGDIWQFSYSPVWTMYSSDEFTDTVNHRALLSGQTTYQAWTLGASQGYTRSRNPFAETGSQALVQRFETRIEGAYDINSRLRFEGDLAQSLREADTAADLGEWTATGWLLYQTAPGVQVGAGVTGGYLDIDGRSNMSYWRLQGRSSAQISQKLSAAVRAGVEWREMGNSREPSMSEPLLGASLVYRPFETTLVSVDYDRSVGNSIFQNRVTETDTVGVELRQRLLGRYSLSVSYSYRSRDYLVTPDFPAGRSDQIDSFNVSLGTQLFRRISGAVMYRYTQNETNRAEFAYESEQYGVQLRYGF